MNIYFISIIAIFFSFAAFKFITSNPDYFIESLHTPSNIVRNEESVLNDNVLVLTILKDEKSWGSDRTFLDHLQIIDTLNYPSLNMSLGFLVSDDSEYQKMSQLISSKKLANKYRYITLIKKDFPHNITRELRHDYRIQRKRRNLIARARNTLLMSALKDENYVLWIDADIIKLPKNRLLQKMMASGKDIITPRCKRGTTEDYDLNAWAGQRKSPTSEQLKALDQGATFVPDKVPGKTKFLGDFRDEDPQKKNEFVQLDSVGGTVLFVKADVHKQGVIFPTEYIVGTTWNRFGFDGIETEGICYLAKSIGATCWGMPHEEAEHHNS